MAEFIYCFFFLLGPALKPFFKKAAGCTVQLGALRCFVHCLLAQASPCGARLGGPNPTSTCTKEGPPDAGHLREYHTEGRGGAGAELAPFRSAQAACTKNRRHPFDAMDLQNSVSLRRVIYAVYIQLDVCMYIHIYIFIYMCVRKCVCIYIYTYV